MPGRPSFASAAHYGGWVFLIISALAYLVWTPLAPIQPPMTDFSAYYAAGRYWSHGGDPYSAGIWSIERTLPGFHASRLELLPFVGPPFSLLLWAGFGALPYAAAAVLWGVIVICSATLIIVVPVRLVRHRIGRTDALSLFFLAVSSGPIVTGISVGQAALPAIAAVNIAILSAVRRRWLLMFCAAIVAALLKPNDALAIAATIRGLGSLLAVVGSTTVSVLANVALAHGIHGLVAYLKILIDQGASERLYAYQFTPTSIAYGFGMIPRAAETLGTLVALAAIGTTIVTIRMTRANLVDGAAIACAAFPFILPFEHEPDMVIALLPALLVVFRARGWTWAIGAAGLVLLSTNPFALTQGWPGVLFAVAMAAVAALQLAALSSTTRSAVRFIPLAVAPLMLALGLFAPTNRLPLWPATVPDHILVAPDASASAVWHAELVASRLENQGAWVSVLRLLTLCGSAAITFAMIRTAGMTFEEKLPQAAQKKMRWLSQPLS
jgi:hypothetical protein